MTPKKAGKVKIERGPSASKAIKKPEGAGKITTAERAPTSAPTPFPIVGIGASAGGLAAFEAFFSGMPVDTDPGMAFVLVQHLAPDHESLLTDLIRRYTRMQVTEVKDGMEVEPNHAYIIPPGRDMALLNGVLHLLEPSSPRGQRLPIDFFFRSLAQDQRERAICIVLSGTGSDGTLGVRAIKGEGGMVMVQSPESTEFDGMPRNAIATGLVDFALPPTEMPAQLIAYVAQAFNKPEKAAARARSQAGTKAAGCDKVPLRELTEQALLQQVAPTGALVNRHGDILYLHGRAGMYLEPTPGEVGVSNILKMAREGLRRNLTTALHKAVGTKTAVHSPGLRVKTNGNFTLVDLTVSPVLASPGAEPEEPLFLVILAEAPPVSPEQAEASTQQATGEAYCSDADARVMGLRQELRAKEEFLQSTNEELETSNEELNSANEELQSVNEEMQSSNEELKTSKEELQSLNEELATVNSELQTKVADLSRVNNDMNNLLSGTCIATIFVDYNMHILRFTPAATKIINLISNDVGRPVAHIVSNLVGYNALVEDVQAVLDTLIPKEHDVQTITGKWYTMNIRPYRTLDNVIEGAVLTFFDITGEKMAKELLRKANDLLRLSVVVRDASDAITVQDLEGRIIAWNPGAERIYGWSEAEALLMNVSDRTPESKKAKAMKVIHKLANSRILKPYRTQRMTKSGREMDIWLTSTALMDDAGKMYAISTTERAAQAK